MSASAPLHRTIDEYIADAPQHVQPILATIRATIRAAAPDALEVISYRMPTFKRDGVLIYFAAFQAHIGIHPPVSGDVALEAALAPYAGPKGNLKFPLGKPMPYALITRMVQHKVAQELAKRSAPGRKRARADGR